MAELRPCVVYVSCGVVEPAPVLPAAPAWSAAGAESPAPVEPVATAPTVACRDASSPEAILAWTSGSSSSSFHIRLVTNDVTTIPITQAGIVMARISVRPRL